MRQHKKHIPLHSTKSRSGNFQEVIMLDQAVVTFTLEEYMQIKRIVLDRDVRGALDFMKIIDKRCEQSITRQGSMKNAMDP